MSVQPVEPDQVAMADAPTVTAALLGTARRPFAGTPARLLDLAAFDRVRVRPNRPHLSARADPCPAEELALAPAAAQEVLLSELARSQPMMIDAMLEHWVAHGAGVDPYAWTSLARLAARSRRIDRPRLGAALGPQGRWFLRQNPEWSRLAADCAVPAAPRRHQAVSAVFDQLAAESTSKPPKAGHIAEVALTLSPRDYPEVSRVAETLLAEMPRLHRTAVVVEETVWWRCQLEGLFDPAFVMRRSPIEGGRHA